MGTARLNQMETARLNQMGKAKDMKQADKIVICDYNLFLWAYYSTNYSQLDSYILDSYSVACMWSLNVATIKLYEYCILASQLLVLWLVHIYFIVVIATKKPLKCSYKSLCSWEMYSSNYQYKHHKERINFVFHG